jgi:putative ubiquitin-RnfH superfamily antitoxin RatB of RatAB toxin-antitoxin module
MAEPSICVEVVHAAVDRQTLLSLTVPVGTTAWEAVQRSGIAGLVPCLNGAASPLGVFGKPVAPDHVLEEGDRVEIYRPLLADPKEVRKQRAARAAQARSAGAKG